MADLDVQPKRASYWWLWLLLFLIALAILLFAVRSCNKTTVVTTDSTTTQTDTSKTLAVTKPDWDNVDFNSAKTTDADITDTTITVTGNDNYTIYTLGENILFATDENTLQGNAGDKLNQIVASLNKRFKGAQVGVYGSTDDTGTAGHNKALGAERAGAVKDWLVNKGGLNAADVTIHSLGENKPVATNTTASGRQQNRNVSIVAFAKK